METLVLDTGYVPVARVRWQRAVTLLFMGKVEVIEEYEDRSIKSVTFSIKMPSIVRFIRALRGKRRDPPADGGERVVGAVDGELPG